MKINSASILCFPIGCWFLAYFYLANGQKNNLPSAREFLVNTENIPNVTYHGKLVNYAGVLPVSESSNSKDKLFFWYFEAEKRSNKLIFWFEG
ncbi:6983_t:CDS:2, partial [Ambispora leptoticha]